MALTQSELASIANYARIALTHDELAHMTDYLNDAIELLNPILEYDLAEVAPSFHPIGDLSNVMRSDDRENRTGTDGVRDLARDVALANAGSHTEDSFRVPSILGGVTVEATAETTAETTAEAAAKVTAETTAETTAHAASSVPSAHRAAKEA